MAENEKEEALISCDTTAGGFVMRMHREWSPNGYDRAVALFERGFYDHSHFYRVVPNFLVQFGISYSADPELKHFARQTIPDDPKQGMSFRPGMISFAGSSDNSRTSQLFISYGSAASLGREKWETPIGEVIEGMEHVKQFFTYGDMPPWGKGPVQGKIHSGSAYIEDNFPKLDKFDTCEVKRISVPSTPLSKPTFDKAESAGKHDDDDDDDGVEGGAAAAAAGAVESEATDDVISSRDKPGRKRLGAKIKKLGAKGKTAFEENGDQMVLIAMLAIGMIIFVSLRNRKKVASKKS